MIFNIPAVRYHRPDGMREPGKVRVDVDQVTYDKLTENLKVMGERNIEVTLELMGPMVNVCLDDDNFDYKFELFPHNETLPDKIKDLVLNFDLDDYLKAANTNYDIEQAAVGDHTCTGITIDSGDGPHRDVTVQEILDEDKGMP